MLNSTKWTTITDGQEVELNPQEPTYNPEIENYTDYEYSTGQKWDYYQNAVSAEAAQTFNQFDDIFTNVGTGLKNASVLFKYLPAIALLTFGYIAINRVKKAH